MLELRDDGVLIYDGICVGEFDNDEKRLVLNLGWIRMSKMKITLEGDPKTDRRRIVLARPEDNVRLEGGDQKALPLNGEKTEEEAKV